MNAPILQFDLPGVKKVRSGKVREVYDLGESFLFVASDRISAFDVIMPNGIPRSHMVLKQFTACVVAFLLMGKLALGQGVLNKDFDGFSQGSGTLLAIPQHGLTLEMTNLSAETSAMRSLSLPIEKVRGRRIIVETDVWAGQISEKPKPWNGIKMMAHLQSPSGNEWPQKDFPMGNFDWQHVSVGFQVPQDATTATLVLGLEKVTGTVRFSHLTIMAGAKFVPASSAPREQVIFKGHDLPRLRGAMVATSMKEEDLDDFTERWNGNLIRWQLTCGNVSEADSGFSAYDKWLNGILAETDLVLGWAKKRHIKVVLDLHSPPGGKRSLGGYMSAAGALFANPRAQAHFIDVWRKMAKRYQGNKTLWGFDLVNEPIDDDTAPGCMNWQALALAAGKAVREIDPERTLIIEPPRGGGPAGFKYFNPVPLDRVVYSFHMYEPGRFTHQRVFRHDESPVSYPGEIDGVLWNRAALNKAMKPAIDFAERYRVHLYVGEFSAVRWAPGAENYLSDVISLFEQYGWDWSYHAFREWDGWSLEHDADLNDHRPSATPTARFEVVEKSWKENRKTPD
jgi:endoglucanase